MNALEAEPDPPTTVRAPAEALDQHVLDSLSGLAVDGLSTASRIGDLGSGAGFPGLVLAAALPAARVDLVESIQRKCEVAARLAERAEIPNVTTVPLRAEEWAGGDGAQAYDVVAARAVAPLSVLVEYAAPLLEMGGLLVAWKGARDPDEERAGVTAAGMVGLCARERLSVRPFEASRERSLYVYRKDFATPDRFPRRPGMARKRPLA